MYSVDEVARGERIGFAGARPAAPDVDRSDSAPRNVDDRRAGLPAASGSLVMSDENAGDVGQGAGVATVGAGHTPDGSVPAVLGRQPPPDNAWKRLWVRYAGASKSAIGDVIHDVRDITMGWAAIGPDTRRGRRFGAFGEGSVIAFPPTTIMNEQYIRIGSMTVLGPYIALSAGMAPSQTCITDPVVSIGDRCLIGRGSGIVGHLSIEIGNDVYTGHHVYITDQNHGYLDRELPISRQVQPERPVRIGSGSWIGHGSVVLPGSTIGRNVVVGANSVVTGTLPDHCVAVGAPARIIRRG